MPIRALARREGEEGRLIERREKIQMAFFHHRVLIML